MDELPLATGPQERAMLDRLVAEVAQREAPLLMPPHSQVGENPQAGNPSDFPIALAPLGFDSQVAGVIQVVQRTDAPPETRRGFMEFLLQCCCLANDYLRRRHVRQ